MHPAGAAEVFFATDAPFFGCHYMPADPFAPYGAELWSLAWSTSTTKKGKYGCFLRLGSLKP